MWRGREGGEEDKELPSIKSSTEGARGRKLEQKSR